MKVIFFHNKAMWYRISFFKEFARFFETEFHFYGNDKIKDFQENVQVKTNIYKMASRLFRRNYDVAVNSSWDSFNDLTRLFISFILVKIMRKKFVLFSEEWGPKTFLRKLASPVINLIARNSDACIVPGKKHKSNLLSMGISPLKIFIAPNSFIPEIRQRDIYKADDLRKNMNLENKKVILFVGRIIERKGIKYLFEALHNIKKEDKNLTLLLIGEGDYKNVLLPLAKELKIEEEVKFLGWINNSDLAPYYLLSDIFVAPSVTLPISEPWGFVINEAVSAGLPVITTEAVGAADELVIHEKNGLIVREKNSEELLEAIKKIIKNDDLRRQMGEASREIVKRFTPEKQAEGFRQAIESVV